MKNPIRENSLISVCAHGDENMNDMWSKLLGFLKEYNMTKAGEALRNVDCSQLLREPLFWLAVIAFLGWVLWKKALRSLLVVCSLVLFVILLHYTLPPAGEDFTLQKLLPFAGGCLGLLAVNIYFLTIRNG